MDFIAEVEGGHAGKTRELVMAIRSGKWKDAALNPELSIAQFAISLDREPSASGRNRLLRHWLAEHRVAVAASWVGLSFPAAPVVPVSAERGRGDLAPAAATVASGTRHGRAAPAMLSEDDLDSCASLGGVGGFHVPAIDLDACAASSVARPAVIRGAPGAAANRASSYAGVVMFDFDQTLTTRHVSYMEDMDNIRDRAFGGPSRVEMLRGMLEQIHARHVAVAIVTMNSRDTIRKAMGRVGLLPFITEGMIFGMENYNTDKSNCKSTLARDVLLPSLGLTGADGEMRALFVDDDVGNVRDMKNACPGISNITAPRSGITQGECNKIMDWLEHLDGIG